MPEDASRDIHILYPEIGKGKRLYADSAAAWARKLGANPIECDVLSLPEASRLNAFVVSAGYHTLSRLPGPVYAMARQALDKSGPGNLISPEALEKHFKGKVILSVSAVTSAMLDAAGLPHYGVVGDFYAQPGLMNKHVLELYSPYKPEWGDELNGRLKVVGGVLLPVGFEDVDWAERRRKLQKGEGASIGFVTHGAGDMATVLSLAGMLKPLKDKRVHAAFFVGQNGWMQTLLENMAHAMDIPVGSNVHGGAGSISIWGGPELETVMQLKQELLPQLDLFVSPTANETALMGPVLVRGARNAMEQANIKMGSQKGWLRYLKMPAQQVWQELGPLFDGDDSSAAQLMLDSVRANLNLTAGRTIISGILQKG